MNKILAKKVIVITESGRKIEYTHVTNIEAVDNSLMITGETLDDVYKLPTITYDTHKIDGVQIMFVEFYKPKT